MSKSILSPFLFGAKCKMLFTWYKLINGKWVNQSGYRFAVQHRIKCAVSSASGNFKKYFEAKQQEVPKPPPTLTNESQKTVIELLTSHPTVSILAGCDILCDAANFAARSTHAASKVYDYTISRQTVTRSILKQKKLAKLQFQKLF